MRQRETPGCCTHPVAAPVQGPTEQVTLYVAYDDPGGLRAQAANIPLPAGRQERAQELLRALLGLYLDKSSSHPADYGSRIARCLSCGSGVGRDRYQRRLCRRSSLRGPGRRTNPGFDGANPRRKYFGYQPGEDSGGRQRARDPRPGTQTCPAPTTWPRSASWWRNSRRSNGSFVASAAL